MDIHDSNKPIRLAIIATYPEMSRIILDMAKQHNVIVDDIYSSFDEAIQEAKRIEKSVDGILSRGGTAAYIKNHVGIPVVSIPITPYDLMLSLCNLENRPKRVAFSNFHRNLYGVREIEQITGTLIEEYTFEEKGDIKKTVLDVKQKGIPVILGGDVAVYYANQLGVRGIEVNSGRDAIYYAFQEMLQLVRVRRREMRRAESIEVVLNTLTEGIMVTDENMNITLANPATRRIFNVLGANLNGKSVKEIVHTDIKLKEALTSQKPLSNHIKSVNGSMININHLPVNLNGDFIGMVSTFEDVTKIQNLEGIIRKQLFTKGFVAKHNFDDIITVDKRMQMVKSISRIYAESSSSVLIEGESGTGKELFAQSIHNASKRKDGPFVAINCSAIPENLFESELFGYAPGAFTGAKKEGKPGLFELAHNGTLFLDEIAEMPITLQTRLLRVIQERELIRIGGDQVIPIDVRILCATNRHLPDYINEGKFREDLYYRISVFRITIPPLRARKCDLLPLLTNFIEPKILADPKMNKCIKMLQPALQHYDWPGNARELQNIAERISLLNSDFLDSDNYDFIFDGIVLLPHQEKKPPVKGYQLNIDLSDGLQAAVGKIEREIIEKSLSENGNNQKDTMEQLKISRSTLWRKLSD